MGNFFGETKLLQDFQSAFLVEKWCRELKQREIIMRERISETYHELININDFPLLYSQLSGRKTLSSLLVAIIDSIPLLPLQRGEGGGVG